MIARTELGIVQQTSMRLSVSFVAMPNVSLHSSVYDLEGMRQTVGVMPSLQMKHSVRYQVTIEYHVPGSKGLTRMRMVIGAVCESELL